VSATALAGGCQCQERFQQLATQSSYKLRVFAGFAVLFRPRGQRPVACSPACHGLVPGNGCITNVTAVDAAICRFAIPCVLPNNEHYAPAVVDAHACHPMIVVPASPARPRGGLTLLCKVHQLIPEKKPRHSCQAMLVTVRQTRSHSGDSRPAASFVNLQIPPAAMFSVALAD
jgi:hypothetical protein